ncbi:MAG: hypothetical protein WC971_09260 [Coriobacteriia bacterium]
MKNRSNKLLAGVTTVVLALAMTLATATSALACTCPTMVDWSIIDRGQTGVGSHYWWGHACWNPSNRAWGGADCSGFVGKSWQVARPSPTTEDYHPYGTWHFFNSNPHWYPIDRGQAFKGDACGYPDPDGTGTGTGHIVLYWFGNPYKTAWVLEAAGSATGIVQHTRDLSNGKWKFIRRHNVIMTAGPI